MPRLALSEIDMVNIVSQDNDGAKIKDIANTYQVDQTTVRRRLERFDKEGNLGKKKVVRRLKVTESDREKLLKTVKDQPFVTRRELKEDLNLPYCEKSITKYCKMEGLIRRYSPKKFSIKQIDCDQRLTCARNRIHWNVEKWKTIVFTDESGLDNSERVSLPASIY